VLCYAQDAPPRTVSRHDVGHSMIAASYQNRDPTNAACI
jgi:hypothetical protein